VSGLARVTDARDSKHEFLNPDHVRSVREIPGGSQITFSDGSTLVVTEAVNIVVAALQGAMSRT